MIFPKYLVNICMYISSSPLFLIIANEKNVNSRNISKIIFHNCDRLIIVYIIPIFLRIRLNEKIPETNKTVTITNIYVGIKRRDSPTIGRRKNVSLYVEECLN